MNVDPDLKECNDKMMSLFITLPWFPITMVIGAVGLVIVSIRSLANIILRQYWEYKIPSLTQHIIKILDDINKIEIVKVKITMDDLLSYREQGGYLVLEDAKKQSVDYPNYIKLFEEVIHKTHELHNSQASLRAASKEAKNLIPAIKLLATLIIPFIGAFLVMYNDWQINQNLWSSLTYHASSPEAIHCKKIIENIEEWRLKRKQIAEILDTNLPFPSVILNHVLMPFSSGEAYSGTISIKEF